MKTLNQEEKAFLCIWPHENTHTGSLQVPAWAANAAQIQTSSSRAENLHLMNCITWASELSAEPGASVDVCVWQRKLLQLLDAIGHLFRHKHHIVNKSFKETNNHIHELGGPCYQAAQHSNTVSRQTLFIMQYRIRENMAHRRALFFPSENPYQI